MSSTILKKCTRNGCKKEYEESENNDQSCRYHPGKPIFHDLKKGWTCCNTIVYDWEEFEKIIPCSTGKHSDARSEDQNEFFKSNTVNNAANAILKDEQKYQNFKTIEEYNKEEEMKLKAAKEKEALIEKKPFITKSGKFKCINKGCNKEYDSDQNTETSCQFHKGEPVFHDVKKYWTCCTKETWDWDEFMKLPTCTQGFHSPKMV